MSIKTRSQWLAFPLAAALMAAANIAAQDFAFEWTPRSGDAWIDQRLGDINDYGARYREPFIDEMTRYYAAPRDLVTDLIVRQRWAPGDVYYACSIAQVIGRPCRYVADEWGRDHGQGWGALAQRLGVKPGSAQFHRLKRGFVPTYERWSHPIVLDDDLRRAFPGRDRNADDHRSNDHDGRGAHGKDHGDDDDKSNGGSDKDTPSGKSGKRKSSDDADKGKGGKKG